MRDLQEILFIRIRTRTSHQVLNSQEFIQLHIRLSFQFNLSNQLLFVTRSSGQLCGNSIQISAPLLRETTTAGKNQKYKRYIFPSFDTI